MKVQVKQGMQDNFVAFYDHARRRPGDVFQIPDQPRRALFRGEAAFSETEEGKEVMAKIADKDGKIPQTFSFRWMDPVDSTAVERISTAQSALTARNEQIKQERAGQRALDDGGKAATTDVL